MLSINEITEILSPSIGKNLIRLDLYNIKTVGEYNEAKIMIRNI